jgi:hypothetical protein
MRADQSGLVLPGEGLDKLHLTYQQLAEMPERRQFSSMEAHKLWVSIGDVK